MDGSSSSVSLIVHAAALVVIYSLYSLLQEKIMKTTYGTLNCFWLLAGNSATFAYPLVSLVTAGPADEHFTSASLLVLSNRLFSLCAGIGFSLLLPKSGEQLSPSQRLRPSWPVIAIPLPVYRVLTHTGAFADLLLCNGRSCKLRFDLLPVRRPPLRRLYDTSSSQMRKDGPCSAHWKPLLQEIVQDQGICMS